MLKSLLFNEIRNSLKLLVIQKQITRSDIMKLLIVRHGDPDYDIDSLTEKGWKEVEYLSQKLSKLDVKAFYVSPLGERRILRLRP